MQTQGDDEGQKLLSDELYIAKRTEINELYVGMHLENWRLSAAFSTLAVNTSFILNGGALFLFPAVIASFRESNLPLDVTLLFVGMGCFVAGIMLAAVACLMGYRNFSHHAWLRDDERQAALIDAEMVYSATTTTTRSNLGRRRDAYQSRQKIRMSKIHRTFHIGVICGIVSFIMFVVGCFIAAKVLVADVKVSPSTPQETNHLERSLPSHINAYEIQLRQPTKYES